jgi:CheY-like chemotaxis protein
MANRTVLIIDDDDDGRAICAAILGHHGYRVLEAATAAAGLDLAASARPDQILANLLLPDLHGWEVRDRLAADPRTSVIPAIAFTGDVRQETRLRSLACGFAAFVGKPAAPKDILAEVERLIGPAVDPTA